MDYTPVYPSRQNYFVYQGVPSELHIVRTFYSSAEIILNNGCFIYEVNNMYCSYTINFTKM
jgi:hypothetical protein